MSPQAKRPTTTYGRKSNPTHDKDVVESSDDGSDTGPVRSSKNNRISHKPASQTKTVNEDASNVTEPEVGTADEGSDSDEDADVQFEVTDIKQHRIKGGRMCYKVGWKNYGSDEDTWEPESNLIGAHELLKAYKLKYNIGIKPKNRTSTASAKSAQKKSRDSDDDSDEEEAERSIKSKLNSSQKRKRDDKDASSTSIAALRKNGHSNNSKKLVDELPSPKKTRARSDSMGSEGSMSGKEWNEQYLSEPSWEHLVHSIRTVKRDDEDVSDKGGDAAPLGRIDVCLLWNEGKTTWVTNEVARAKLPQKLLNFYEDHLQFAPAES